MPIELPYPREPAMRTSLEFNVIASRVLGLHRGIDGRKVTMYAQWASIDDYEAMRKDSGSSPALEKALAFAKFDPGMYEVAEIFISDENK